MAYNKVYNRTYWNNDKAPAINATNLNNIESGIDTIDGRVCGIGNNVDSLNENMLSVKSGLMDLAYGEVGGKNIYNKDALILGYGLYSSNGTMAKSAGYNCTDFIKVSANTNYVLSGEVDTDIIFYDSNRAFISVSVKHDFTTPNNCAYVRFNVKDAYLNNNLMLEKGSQATSYEPYIGQSVKSLNDSLLDLGTVSLVDFSVATKSGTDYYVFVDLHKGYKYVFTGNNKYKSFRETYTGDALAGNENNTNDVEYTPSKSGKFVLRWYGEPSNDLYLKVIHNVGLLNEEVSALNNSLHDLEFLGWETPSECPIQNSFDGKTFTQRVGRVDLGSLSWVKDSSGTFYVTIPKANTNNLYVEGFTVLDTNYQFNKYSTYSNKTIGSNSNNYIYAKYTDSADATAFKNAMNGKYLYYELATPIIHNVGSEAVERVNDSLNAQGLLNKWDGTLFQGYTNTTTNYEKIANANDVTLNDLIAINGNDFVSMECDSSITVAFLWFNSSRQYIGNVVSRNGKAPTEARYFSVNMSKGGLTTSNIGKLAIYVNNEISQLKADLNGLSGGSNYSTTEKVVGKWIDGRNIYEQVFDIDVVSATGGNVRRVLASGIDFCVDSKGYISGDCGASAFGIVKFSIPYYGGGIYGSGTVSANITVLANGDMELTYRWNVAGKDLKIQVVAQYVKK